MLSNAWSWIKDKWSKFETWVNSVAPGFKTYSVLFLGAVGNGAAIAQQFIQGLPANTIFTVETLTIANVVLFSLAFWFKDMGTRTS